MRRHHIARQPIAQKIPQLIAAEAGAVRFELGDKYPLPGAGQRAFRRRGAIGYRRPRLRQQVKPLLAGKERLVGGGAQIGKARQLREELHRNQQRVVMTTERFDKHQRTAGRQQ